MRARKAFPTYPFAGCGCNYCEMLRGQKAEVFTAKPLLPEPEIGTRHDRRRAARSAP